MKRVAVPIVELIATIADLFPLETDRAAMQTGAGWKRLLLFEGQIQVCLVAFFFGNSFPHAPVVRQELLRANRQCCVHVPPGPMSGNALVDLVNQLVDEPSARSQTQHERSFGGFGTLLRLDAAVFFEERAG